MLATRATTLYWSSRLSVDAADLEQRDRVALRGSWLQWALVPAGGEAVVGSVSDAAGIDDIHTVWVDEADFCTTITYEQVENADVVVSPRTRLLSLRRTTP